MNSTTNISIVQPEDKQRGAIASSSFMLIVLLLLFLAKCSSQEKEFPAEGVMINLGTTETGMGTDRPESRQPAQVQESAPQEASAEQTEEVVTQDTETSLAIEDETDQVEANTDEEVDESSQEDAVSEEQQVNESDLFGPQSINNNPGNEGVTEGPGDQGVEEGNLSSNIYEGIHSGLGDDGFGWGLDGRSLVQVPKPQENSQETGKVVVDILVNNEGKVLRATVNLELSTTQDAGLVQTALKASKEAKFNADPQAPLKQKGYFVYIFKVQ